MEDEMDIIKRIRIIERLRALVIENAYTVCPRGALVFEVIAQNVRVVVPEQAHQGRGEPRPEVVVYDRASGHELFSTDDFWHVQEINRTLKKELARLRAERTRAWNNDALLDYLR